jgi:alkylation response protein AidB-like acyl-CoA dehydrogenase
VDFSKIELDDAAMSFWEHEVVPFFDETLPAEVIDAERAQGNGLIPSLDQALAARGWTDITGLTDTGPSIDPLQLAIVRAEEASRVGPLLPVKGSHLLVLAVVHAFASPELRDEIFPGLARSEITCCLGYTEPDCGSDAAAITTRAERDGDEWVITGQKMFSTGAHLANYVMMTARTNPDSPKHKGITMFLLPTDSDGLETQGIGTLGGERTNFIYLDQVRVHDSHRLGPIDQGWQVASGALAAEHGMDAAHGGLQRPAAEGEAIDALSGIAGGWSTELSRILDATIEWLRHQLGPDGRSPLDDPVVRNRLARVALDCEAVTVTPSPYARILGSDIFIQDAEELVDITGPAGLLSRGQAGAAVDGTVEWAHRFAQGTSIYGGTTDIQRNLIAEHLLGLPRHRGVIRS